MKIKMYFEGDTGYPAFSKLQVARIQEVADWMTLSARVSDNPVWETAREALLDAVTLLNSFTDGEDDAEDK